MSVVRENSSQSEGRFVFYDEHKTAAAYVSYTLNNGELDLQHTVTDPNFRGKGLAEVVVRAAFEWGEKENFKVIPTCSYISGNFLKKNPKFQELCKL